MRTRLWVMAVLAVSCEPALPSTVPLGRGPLAASTVETPPPPRAAPAADAGQTSAEDAGGGAGGAEGGSAGPREAAEGGSAGQSGAGGAGGGDAAPEAAGGSKAAVVFAGHYSGRDVTTVQLGNQPSHSQKDPNAKLDVADAGGGTLEFSLIASKSGKVICKLEGTVSGNTATLRSGQRCFDAQSQGHMTATIDHGKATFNGTRLVFDMHLDMEIDIAGRQITGAMDYLFEGTR